jgi:hypothetical protein
VFVLSLPISNLKFLVENMYFILEICIFLLHGLNLYLQLTLFSSTQDSPFYLKWTKSRSSISW